jgi:hypothetical protein
LRKIVFLVALLGLFPLLTMAQTPKAEVFGGYQFTHFGSSGVSENFNGWNASATGNINFVGCDISFPHRKLFS